jgi:DtxR family Mn-dependent transcriptional regulator
MALQKQEKLSASLEDYLEAIFNLSSENKVARSKDIAELLGVSRASVTGALRTLSQRKLVNYKPYGFATLTETGAEAAGRIVKRHNVIKSFFVDVLGVDDAVAQEAACRAEHALGPAIINRLLKFIEFVDSGSKSVNLTKSFKRFCEESQLSEES